MDDKKAKEWAVVHRMSKAKVNVTLTVGGLLNLIMLANRGSAYYETKLTEEGGRRAEIAMSLADLHTGGLAALTQPLVQGKRQVQQYVIRRNALAREEEGE